MAPLQKITQIFSKILMKMLKIYFLKDNLAKFQKFG